MVVPNHTEQFEGFIITTDKGLMKVSDIHRWLSEEAYWSKEIPFETVQTAFENSYCVGVLLGDRQVGFGRLVTDYATFAYLADVYVEEAHRGKGLSKRMMEILFSMEWVKGLRRMMLSTIHAHELYRKYGFTACRYPDRLMEVLLSPDMYKAQRQ
ncbi:MAG: GNAT family N-acetyltransferase [Taibaiella sp.]|nr:GNAT family N-acetyltransferase [Taibaiella sp.]